MTIPRTHLLRLSILFMLAALIMLALVGAGCASPDRFSPTAPTSSITAAPLAAYRWDFVAPGCQVAAPAPNLTAVAPHSVLLLPGVGVRVFYTDGARRANGDQDYIGGDFRWMGKAWALCAWDRYTRGVNP